MRVFWAALCVAVFACVLTFPLAASEPQMARGAVCDTVEQITMFGSLHDEVGAAAALKKVNDDAGDPEACVVIQFTYEKLSTGATMKIAGSEWIITQVRVIQVLTPFGMIPVDASAVYYGFFPAEGRPA
jgi:hypothetical protein